MEAARLTFGKDRRILRNTEFKRIFRTGKRYSLPHLTLIFRLRDSKTDVFPPRMGLSVSKKVGKAHDRNLVKRRLREIFRIHHAELRENAELVFIPRKEAVEVAYLDLENDVMKLFQRAKLLAKVG